MYIYKITHKSTHQSYIGQTSNPFARWESHSVNQDLPIQKSIREEGLQCFTFEILEKCADQEANDRETYWIHYYHAVSDGYNTTYGEGQTPTTLTLHNLPINKKDNRNKVNSPDGVDAYDQKTGEFVCHYESIAAANRALGHEGTGNISAVCRGRGRTAYGFVWKYTTPQQ